MPNRLSQENSPYLLQHAENPVDWYPWDETILEIVRSEGKPIFLSIGYAACHWCHVMAHESFEDPDIAKIMNEHFINIKVDREEKPDIDHIYMSAVVSMTGQGGWPLSVFLTPDGEPFFGGTYFPPQRRYNMPSFREVLLSVIDVWSNDRDKIVESSQKISKHLRNTSITIGHENKINRDYLDRAALRLAQSYDWDNGGWGQAPKFPQPMSIEFLLNRAVNGDKLAEDIANHALSPMAKGGMYDVIGGGFARYSTDDSWLVPHFEKMLYDNALLARTYLHGYLVTREPLYRQICEKTLDFIIREMTHPEGGFYSSLDADSEGEEGKFYLWTIDEIRKALPHQEDADLAIEAYSITDSGNFEGLNVLQRTVDVDQLAHRFKMTENDLERKLSQINKKLLAEREKRVRPGVDDKVLVFWNALAVIAFSEAGRYLGIEDYVLMATRNIDFLISGLLDDNTLMRSWRHGQTSNYAYLEDYACLILALLSLYQTSPTVEYYHMAVKLADDMILHFSDPDYGFFDTRADHEPLIFRPKDLQDNATPCGNSLAVQALLHLAAYTGRGEWRDRAESSLRYIIDQTAKFPLGYSNWLSAIDFAIANVAEVALLGSFNHPISEEMLEVLWAEYRPHLVLAQSNIPITENAPPLLMNRHLQNDQPTAYVCRNQLCKNPVNTAAELREQLLQ